MQQQRSAVPARSQHSMMEANLVSRHDHLQQQPRPQTAAVGTGSNAGLGGGGPTKHWQGGLYNVNTRKGEEFVCELVTDAWPAHLPRCVLPRHDVTRDNSTMHSLLPHMSIQHSCAEPACAASECLL